MKINRFFALAVIALLVVGAMGAISLKGFAKGGKTNSNMKTMGRGMAKVVNQRTSSSSKSGRGR